MARFANPAYDKLLAQAASSQDPAEQARLLMRPRPSCRRRPHRPHLPVHQCPAHQALAQGYPINNPEDVAYSRQLYLVKH